MGQPAPPPSSDYTRILKGAAGLAGPPVAPAPLPPASAPAAPAPAAPAAPAAPPGADGAPPGGPSYLPLWILLNVVVILAVALLLYVILRRH
jgi:hypothetical protein